MHDGPVTKYIYYRDYAAIICSAIFVFVLIALFMFLPSEESQFDRLAQFIAIVSVALAPFVYFLKTKHSENSERTRASRNLYAELDNTLDALDEKSHPDNFKVVEFKGGKKYYFMNRMLNHDFYDSLVFSGKINFLPTGIQQKTQDAFQLIKDHNSFIRSIRDIEDRADPVEDRADPVEDRADPVEDRADPVEDRADPVEDRADPVEDRADPVEDRADPVEDRADPVEDVTPKTRRYYEALHRAEVELLAESGIRSLKEKLEKEFKIF